MTRMWHKLFGPEYGAEGDFQEPQDGAEGSNRRRRNVQSLDEKFVAGRESTVAYRRIRMIVRTRSSIMLRARIVQCRTLSPSMRFFGLKSVISGLKALARRVGWRTFEGIAEIGGVHLAKDLGRKTLAVRGLIDLVGELRDLEGECLAIDRSSRHEVAN